MSNDSTIWLREHDACENLGQDVMVLLNQRNHTEKKTPSFIKFTAEIRSKHRQFTSKLSRLQEDLNQSSRTYIITERECERRQQLIDKLRTRDTQIQTSLTTENTWSDTRKNRNPFDDADDNDDCLASLTPETFKQQQHQIIAEQDKGLDSLSKVISRQKQIALDIGNEVDTQNEILDDIIDHTSRTDTRIQTETRHIKIVDRKSGTCGFWVAIVLLMVTIIVIVAVPYKHS